MATQSMQAAQNTVIAWLNDAYAMENGIVEALEKRVDAASEHPTIQGRIQQHLEETRRHAETVKGCIEQLGGKPSGLKSGMASIGGKLQGVMSGAAPDNLVKAALQDYSTEHMEIASYKALIIAAEDIGQPEVARKCEGILREEEEMARWLDEQLPTVVRDAIARGGSNA